MHLSYHQIPLKLIEMPHKANHKITPCHTGCICNFPSFFLFLGAQAHQEINASFYFRKKLSRLALECHCTGDLIFESCKCQENQA